MFGFFKKKGKPDTPVDTLDGVTKKNAQGNSAKIEKLKKETDLDSRLRLAMLLQKDGENDEAFGELSFLLAKGTPESNPEFRYSDKSQIYDKMRLFLQREGKPEAALPYHLLSRLCFVMHFQKIATGKISGLRETFDTADAEETVSRLVSVDENEPANIRSYLQPALKKAKRPDLLESMTQLFLDMVKEFPKLNDVEVMKKVEALILKTS